jgi:DNA polymerase III delta subunit
MSVIIYGLAAQLRKACHIVSQLERGVSAKQLESSLSMHPYAARKLIDRLRNKRLDELHQAVEALADLEVWCRGGADYGDEMALTLALRRATGSAVAA